MASINESYLNIGYVLNRLANIADTKSILVDRNSRYRKEEDFAYRKSLDPKLIEESVSRLFYEPISTVVTESFAQFFADCIRLGLNNYIEIIKRVPMEGAERKKISYILNKYLVVETLASIIWKVGREQMQTDNVPSFYCDRNPFKSVIDFYEGQHVLPEHALKAFFDDRERTIRKWRSGEDIPNINNLKQLAQWASLSNPDGHNEDKETLFLSRFIDSFHRQTNHRFVNDLKDAVVWRIQHRSEPNLDLGQIFHQFYISEIRASSLQKLSAEGNDLHQLLKRTSTKPHGSLADYSARLAALQRSVDEHDLSGALQYHHEWLQGRILILSGKVDAALEQYVKAVESSLYKSGNNIRDLLKEALGVAAIKHKPHKPTMKRLKSRALTFYPNAIEPHLRRLPVTITDEDIEAWRFWFVMRFPQSGWFEEGRESLMAHLQLLGLAKISSKCR